MHQKSGNQLQQPLAIGEVFASPRSQKITKVIHYQDLLMTAKLHFFAFIAGILKPFLVLFQTDNPMLPLMYNELSKISKHLIVLIYKKEKIDEAKTVSKAMKEDWLKNKNHQMEEFLIDIGAAVKND